MVMKIISIVILIAFSSKSNGDSNLILKDSFIKNNLINNLLKNFIEIEKLHNILILAKTEHLVNFDVSVIGKITTMKIYARAPGWRNLNRMFEFKWMSYLLIFKRFYEVEDYIEQIRHYRHFNPRLRFIIIPLISLSKTDFQIFSEILIRFKIINYVIIRENLDRKIIDLITNFPYKNRSCGLYTAVNDEIVATFDAENGFIFNQKIINQKNFYPHFATSLLYPSKIPTNLQKCKIYIVTGLWPPNVIDINRKAFPGIEIEFVRMIAHYMNIVPRYLYLNAVVGEKYPNRSWNGYMGYLKRNEIDMAIGAVHVDPNRDYIFDVSYWYLENIMLWIVPRMGPPPKSAILAHFIIESSTLAKTLFIWAFLITFFGAFISARLIKSLDSQHYGQIGYILVVLVQILISQTVHKLPHSVRVRKIFGTWMGFSVFIIFLFQTQIISYFMSPGKAIQLENIEDAFKLHLKISYDKYYDPFVVNASRNFVVPTRNEEHPVIPSLNMVAKGEAVTVIDRLRAVYITKQWLREDGSIPIQLLYNNPVRHYWVNIVMTKGHFLFPWIDELVRKAGNNGFWNFKENQYIERRTIQYSVRRQIILMNDIHGLPNKKAVDRYNDAVYEAFPKGLGNEAVNEIFKPTASSERDLLDMFRVAVDSSIAFQHLEAVFELFSLGVILSILAFLGELCLPKLKMGTHKKYLSFKIKNYFKK